MNPLLLKGLTSPFTWLAVMGGVFFVYYQHSQAKAEKLETQLTVQIEETKKAIESINQIKDTFEAYKIIVEEQNRKLSELESEQDVISKQTTDLKKQVTSNTLKQNGLNNKEFEHTINEKSKQMIDELKEISK